MKTHWVSGHLDFHPKAADTSIHIANRMLLGGESCVGRTRDTSTNRRAPAETHHIARSHFFPLLGETRPSAYSYRPDRRTTVAHSGGFTFCIGDKIKTRPAAECDDRWLSSQQAVQKLHNCGLCDSSNRWADIPLRRRLFRCRKRHTGCSKMAAHFMGTVNIRS